MASTTQGKKRTTIYIDEDVLEFLAIRRARGSGSVSQQLENLARAQMPLRLSAENLAAMEARDVEGYKKQPLEIDKDWLEEQVWDEV